MYTAKILDDLPIINGNKAKFQFEAYANTIARIILSKNTKTPLVIGLNGKWGTGKTSLLRILESKLSELSSAKNSNGEITYIEKEGIKTCRACKTIWFNAWKYGRKEEILISLIDRIRREMSKDRSFIEKAQEKVKGFNEKYNVPEMLTGILSSLLTGGLVSVDLRKYAEESSLRDNIVFYDEFQLMFNDLIDEFVNGNEEGVLTVLIDDLDRCVPDKVMEVLETIKLFMDTTNCVFVLGLDPDMVIEAIRAYYAARGVSEVNAKEYMGKIVQVEFNIPPLRLEDAAKFIRTLTEIEEPTGRLLRLLVSSIPTNPRRIKTFLNHIELQWAVLCNSDLGERMTKTSLTEWLILQEVCSTFCDQLKKLDSDETRVEYINEVKEFAKAGDTDKRSMIKGNEKLKEVAEDKLLLDILSQGSFKFSPRSMGVYIHLTPAPGLRLIDDPMAMIKEAITTLSPREQRVLALRFGLEDGKVYTLEGVGKEFNLTGERIRQIEAKSLRRLRHPSHSRKLKDILGSGRKLDKGHENILKAIFGERVV